MAAQETIDRFCERDDLSQHDVLALAAARREETQRLLELIGTREDIREGAWRIELTARFDGYWTAEISLADRPVWNNRVRCVCPVGASDSWKGYADRETALEAARAKITEISPRS